jgi:hypothetical protein
VITELVGELERSLELYVWNNISKRVTKNSERAGQTSIYRPN